MELGVEHLVLHAPGLEHFAQQLGLLNGDGAHQHRLALLVVLHNVVNHSPVLGLCGLIDHVRAVLPNHGPVGGDFHHVQPVDFRKLLPLGHGGACHAGELFIHAEVVLEGNGGQGPALPGHLDPLLGLNGLVEALVIPAAVHQAAGKLVHNDDLAVLDHIVLVPVHNAPGPDGLVHMVLDADVVRVGQVLQMEELLGPLYAPAGEGAGLQLFVDNVVILRVQLVIILLLVCLLHPDRLEGAGQGVGLLVEVRGLLPLAGDNQGGAGLVNQDRVHLVHNGVVVAPLDLALLIGDHVVPQIVKAHLVVGAIGDVAGIGGLLGLRVHACDGQAHSEAHKVEDSCHHLPLVLGQVLVDRDNMHPFAREGVEVGGQGQGKGFALAGFHLSDAALVQDNAALNLHREQALGEHPVHGLPAGCESLGEDVVQGLALLQQLAEAGGLGLEVRV